MCARPRAFMSSGVYGAPLLPMVMPCAASVRCTAAGSCPARLNDTRPDSSRPWSSTSMPAMARSSARKAWATRSMRARMASRPISSASCNALARPARNAIEASADSKRVASSRSCGSPSAPSGAEWVSTNAGARRGRNSRRTYSRPVPRGPRRALRPAPLRTSQPTSATSIGTCPTACAASMKYGTPAARVTRPMAAAGLIRPPLAGNQVSATRRTRSSSMARSASASTQPLSSDGIVSMLAPARCAASRMAARLPPHSWRPTRMRSPGRQGPSAANAAPHPGELPPVRAISPGWALSSCAANWRACSVWARAATPASIGPCSASRRRWAWMASSVAADGNDAPAWLKWTVVRVPGVAARSASRVAAVRTAAGMRVPGKTRRACVRRRGIRRASVRRRLPPRPPRPAAARPRPPRCARGGRHRRTLPPSGPRRRWRPRSGD